MKILIKNKAKVSKKYTRYIKWRLHKLKTMFKDLNKAEVQIRKMSQSTKLFVVHINLHNKDNTVFVSTADQDLNKIIKLVPNKLQNTLSLQKSKDGKQLSLDLIA